MNTAIAALMAMVNEFYSNGLQPRATSKQLLLMLSPFAPHMVEETVGADGLCRQA